MGGAKVIISVSIGLVKVIRNYFHLRCEIRQDKELIRADKHIPGNVSNQSNSLKVDVIPSGSEDKTIEFKL